MRSAPAVRGPRPRGLPYSTGEAHSGRSIYFGRIIKKLLEFRTFNQETPLTELLMFISIFSFRYSRTLSRLPARAARKKLAFISDFVRQNLTVRQNLNVCIWEWFGTFMSWAFTLKSHLPLSNLIFGPLLFNFYLFFFYFLPANFEFLEAIRDMRSRPITIERN